jgi:cystathionine beta-lyase family protein involved in aluminum resistance
MQFASMILVIFAAITCASPISSFIAAQGWMMPILGTRARVPRIMVDDLFMQIVVI